MKLLVFSSLLCMSSAHFLGLPDPLGLFGPKCPQPEPCVCVCDKHDTYVPPPPPPPPHYPVKPSYQAPPPPPPVAYQEAPPPSYVPAPYVPPPPTDYQTPPTYHSGPVAPNMPVYNSGMDSMGPPGSSPNYVPEFKARRKAAKQ
ncbi:hypothetical protein PENTCL1PPCAC_4166 [Pristionchus entomophagus]|uniref:Uncharacterized protein n=1 Tax=Pristionchus entomophagus TaxID=358040 RepID=A0AAV5SF78_9BILA|nr:hypothetical protein PENTCL1PPCAC_4166 [Pristionchus entomophagus]